MSITLTREPRSILRRRLAKACRAAERQWIASNDNLDAAEELREQYKILFQAWRDIMTFDFNGGFIND